MGSDINLTVGVSYPQDGAMLRVIAVKDNTVLLEQWRNDELIQYIVTSGLFLHEGELHWWRSGEYFSCMYPPPVCDAPFDVLRKALEYINYTRAGCSTSSDVAKTNEVSFNIPNGIQIVAELNGDAKGSGDNWSSIDVSAKFPNGHHEMLCSVEFETMEGNPRGI